MQSRLPAQSAQHSSLVLTIFVPKDFVFAFISPIPTETLNDAGHVGAAPAAARVQTKKARRQFGRSNVMFALEDVDQISLITSCAVAEATK